MKKIHFNLKINLKIKIQPTELLGKIEFYQESNNSFVLLFFKCHYVLGTILFLQK